MSFIEITEEWVKDRVKISKEKLDDIKSLSLPGTYDEKILQIASSLIHFTRLKELDLSRNVIENLDGLSHLQCLESLNLYYNNVASLKELYKLRNNQKLSQLDLRLNPVARNEADYRLCLIHMLPLLIRLDDRCVKDEERKAALMYFGSDQSREFSPNKSDDAVTIDKSFDRSIKKTHPRVEMVNRWTKGVLVDNRLDKDSFGDEAFHLNLDGVRVSDDTIVAPRDKELRSVREYSPRVFNGKRLDVEREFSSFRQSEMQGNVSTVPVYIHPDDRSITNKTHSKDSHSAFSLYQTHLADRANGDGLDVNILDNEKVNSNYNNYTLKTQQPSDVTDSQYVNVEDGIPQEIINRICDLVDRHWNGSRSLHQNPKFKNNLNNILSPYFSNMQSDVDLTPININSTSRFTNGKSDRLTFQVHNTVEKDEISTIKLANETLKDQIKDLRQKLNISEKYSELTELLKQSHESLITTNEQLRKQLEYQSKKF